MVDTRTKSLRSKIPSGTQFDLTGDKPRMEPSASAPPRKNRKTSASSSVPPRVIVASSTPLKRSASPSKPKASSSKKSKAKKPRVFIPSPSPEPSVPSASSSEDVQPSVHSSEPETFPESLAPSSPSKSVHPPASVEPVSEESEDFGYSPSATAESESVSLCSSPSAAQSSEQPSPSPATVKGKGKVVEESSEEHRQKPSSGKTKARNLKDKVFSERSVLSSKFVPPEVFSIFEGHDLLFDFHHQGWVTLLTTPLAYSEATTIAFYSSLTVEKPGYSVFSVNYKGIKMTFDAEKVNNILGVPNEGTVIGSPLNFADTPYFPSSAQLTLLTGSSKLIPTSVMHMSPIVRLSLRVYAECLNPRIGSFSKVNHLDLSILAHLKAKKRINLGSLIVTKIIDAANRDKKSLLYGNFICSKFLNAFPEALLGSEAYPVPAFSIQDLYEMKLLHRTPGTAKPDQSSDAGTVMSKKDVDLLLSQITSQTATFCSLLQTHISKAFQSMASELQIFFDITTAKLSSQDQELAEIKEVVLALKQKSRK